MRDLEDVMKKKNNSSTENGIFKINYDGEIVNFYSAEVDNLHINFQSNDTIFE